MLKKALIIFLLCAVPCYSATLLALKSDDIDAADVWSTDGLTADTPWASVTSADTLDTNGFDIDITVSVEVDTMTNGASGGTFTISDGDWYGFGSTQAFSHNRPYVFDADSQTLTLTGGIDNVQANEWIYIPVVLYPTNWQNCGFKYVTAIDGEVITFGSDASGASGVPVVDEVVTASPTQVWYAYRQGIIIDADITAGVTTCLTSTVGSGDAVLVIGDVTGGSASSARGIVGGSEHSLFVHGDLLGGSGTNCVALLTSTAGCLLYCVGDVIGGDGVYAFGVAAYSATSKAYIYGNIINLSKPSASDGFITWQPASSSNYIQYPDGDGGVVKAYADTYLPSDDEIKAGVDNGQGGTGIYRGDGAGASYRGGIYR